MNSTKVAIYCRVAQANEEIIAQQEETMLQFAGGNGYSVIACYRDNGESGLSLDRPGMKNLIGDIQDGKIQTVIALDFSRVARGLAPMREWFTILKKYDTLFVSVRDNFQYPNDDCFSALFENLALT